MVGTKNEDMRKIIRVTNTSQCNNGYCNVRVITSKANVSATIAITKLTDLSIAGWKINKTALS
jgi:hypothetical protein